MHGQCLQGWSVEEVCTFLMFECLNHSLISSRNITVCIRFIVFLQVSFCYFICKEFCWMRSLCISFKSLCFLFPVGGGSKQPRPRVLGSKRFEDSGEELKSFRIKGVGEGGSDFFWGGVTFAGGSRPHYMASSLCQITRLEKKQKPNKMLTLLWSLPMLQ